MRAELASAKNMLPNGLDWLCYLGGRSKNHHGNNFFCHFCENLIRYENCFQITARNVCHFIASDSYSVNPAGRFLFLENTIIFDNFASQIS